MAASRSRVSTPKGELMWGNSRREISGQLKVEHEDVGWDTAAELIASHYQQSFDLAYRYWRERNRLFGLLLLLLALAALLSVQATASTLLVTVVANTLGVEDDADSLDALQQSFSIALINGATLAGAAFLIFLVYQRTRYLNLLYAYLRALESELRGHLQLAKSSRAFTREGDFYESLPSDLVARLIRVAYLSISGLLLVSVFVFRVFQDAQAHAYWNVAVDCAFGALSILFYWGYVREARRAV
ncbi:hypothetical protein [Geodermatophilus sp. SYSU D00710]